MTHLKNATYNFEMSIMSIFGKPS